MLLYSMHLFQVSGELPGASPDHMMSPGAHGGKRVHPIPYISHSRTLSYLISFVPITSYFRYSFFY
jgi:hypothetical protein